MSFPNKVWLFTIFVAPLFILFTMLIDVGLSIDILAMAGILYLYILVFGAVSSLISRWIFNLLFKDIKDVSLTQHQKKLLFTITGLILIWITFWFLNRLLHQGNGYMELSLPISYSLAFTTGVIIFNLNKGKNEKQAV